MESINKAKRLTNDNKPVDPAYVDSDGNVAKRAVAKKSMRPSASALSQTSSKESTPEPITSTLEFKGKNKVIHIVPSVQGCRFSAHTCDADCLFDPKLVFKAENHKDKNPLDVPIALGWKREVAMKKIDAEERKKTNREKVYYGRPLRAEAQKYE